MRKITTLIGTLILSSSLWANVPTLADALQNQTDFTVSQQTPQLFNLEAINDALSLGYISQQEATHLRETLRLTSQNSEFFNFDVGTTIASALSEGVVTPEVAAQVMTIFNQLSPEDKVLVGNQAFTAEASNSLYQQLSEGGKTLVDSAPNFSTP